MKIVIDGNIGSGKTSIITEIQNKTRMPVFLEPVNDWTEYLHAFYKDSSKYALTFNLKVLCSFEKWKSNSFTALYERSPESCRNIFHALHVKNGIINDLETAVFEEIYQKLSWKPDVFIYINTPAEICYERMQCRNRDSEKNVPLSYLKELDTMYNEYVNTIPNAYIFDGTCSIDTLSNDIIQIVKSYS